MSQFCRDNFTLQINLCAGDVRYCEAIVPVLVHQHRDRVREVIVVFDTCRPQSSPYVHQATRFAAEPFAERIRRLEEILEEWKRSGLIDRIVRMDGDRKSLRALNLKYTGVSSDATHDHLGHASAAYYLAWEAPTTRYVLHFDADILFHQVSGADWAETAWNALQRRPSCIAVSPRIAPPKHLRSEDELVDLSRLPSCGWLPTWPLREVEDGWVSPWFSTRCHLLDRQRLAFCLPLTSGAKRRRYAAASIVNWLLDPLIRQREWISSPPASGWRSPGRRISQWLASKIPEFPLPPEVLIHEQNIALGKEVLYLNEPKAWFIHPHSKPERFYELLPALLRGTKKGIFPEEQAGMCEIDLDAWRKLSEKGTS